MPITVLSTNPIDGETNITTQKEIVVTFSTAVDRTSVNKGTLVLYETNGGVPVDGNITFSNDSTIVSFLPTSELQQSFSYTFTVVGAGEGLVSNVLSSIGDSLANSYTVNFRTGQERFVSLSEIVGRTDIAHVAPIRDVAELAKVTGVLSITDSSPDGFSSNNIDPSTITITFDDTLNAASYDPTWMVVTMTPILDYEDWYYGADDGGLVKLKIEDMSLTFPPPSATISISDNQLIWTKTSGDWPYNAEVSVTLSKKIVSTSGNKLGADITVLFTTQMFPLFVGSNYLRLEVGPVVKNLFDDTLNRIALKRGIEAWELTGRSFDIRNPIYAAREFTRFGAVIDVIDDLALKSDLAKGSRKKLGDFEIDYGNRANIRDSGKYQSAKEGIEKSEYKLRRWSPTLRPMSSPLGKRSPTGPVYFQGMRNWDNLLTNMSTKLPASNWKDQRIAQIAYDNNTAVGRVYNPAQVLSVFYGKFSGADLNNMIFLKIG